MKFFVFMCCCDLANKIVKLLTQLRILHMIVSVF